MANKTIEQLEQELEKAKAIAEAANKENESLRAEVDAFKAKEEASSKENEILAAKAEEKVKYTAPLVPGILEADLQVSINGQRWTIMRGVEVEIPVRVKKIIDRADKMKIKAQRNAAELRARYDAAVKAKAI